MTIPKDIWFLWYQGVEAMPTVVKACYDSWLKMNPGWQVHFLDREGIAELVDVRGILGRNSNAIGLPGLSDVVRSNLLADRGGVWVDATCFCMASLDDWLEPLTGDGFFAFHSPAADRMVASWFQAASPGSYIAQAWRRATNRYWRDNRFRSYDSGGWSRVIRNGLVRILRLRTRWWFSTLVRRGMRLYPYFWYHYLFAELYRTDVKFRESWNAVPPMHADGPHRLQHAGLLVTPIPADAKRAIDERQDPLYKLTWRMGEIEVPVESTLGYLLNA